MRPALSHLDFVGYAAIEALLSLGKHLARLRRPY
jgi:hypothetical protein